jgi:hypothetical protein
MTTQDDIIVGGVPSGGVAPPVRLGKGSDGQVLTVDPTTHHLIWAAPTAGLDASLPITAITLSGTYNDWSPAAIATTGTFDIFANPSAVIITGIDATGTSSGRRLTLLNRLGATVTLNYLDAGSAAANQIVTPSGRNFIIPTGGAVVLEYGTATVKWRVISTFVLSTVAGVAVGTAAAGTSSDSARADHVHPTGAGTPVTQAFGDAAAIGTGPAAAMTDHKHGMPAAPTTIANDTIWAAAGDLAVGTGSHTAAKLAIIVPAANILEVLGVVNGETTASWKAVHDATAPTTQAFGDAAAAGTALTASHRDHKHAMMANPWTAAQGSSMPAQPAYGNNIPFFRSDLGEWYYYDGTRWLSTHLYQATWNNFMNTALAATTSAYVLPVPPAPSDIYLVGHREDFFVNGGGTALGASHNWVGVLAKIDVNAAATTVSTITINSGSSGVFRMLENATINAALTAASYFTFKETWTKTGTPGALQAIGVLSYRKIAT